jgi:hypothetical protein
MAQGGMAYGAAANPYAMAASLGINPAALSAAAGAAALQRPGALPADPTGQVRDSCWPVLFCGVLLYLGLIPASAGWIHKSDMVEGRAAGCVACSA